MFAIIKNNQLIWFTDYKPTEENMNFDKLIKGNFDTNKNYKYEDWIVIDITPIRETPKEPTNEEKLIEIENNLLILSSKITWLKQLIENKLNTEDDLILLENLSLQAKELAGQRKILKNTLLTNI